MFKKVEVFYAEKVIRINMFISKRHGLARAYIGGGPSKRLIFSSSKSVAEVCEKLSVKQSRYLQSGAVKCR